MDDPAFRAEWDRLVAERAMLRREIAGALEDIASRARDPLGIASRVREHPLLAAGLAAGAGALFGVLRARSAPRRREGGGLFGRLANMAVRTFAPWLAEAVEPEAPEDAEDDAVGYGSPSVEQPNGR